MKTTIYKHCPTEIFAISKTRYNTHQCGNGVIASKSDRLRDRNSKFSKREKQALKEFY